MEITPTTLILVGLTCVVLGFIASLLLNTLREDTDVPDEGFEQTPPGGRKGRYTAIARLWRERGSGKMVVEMDGRSFLTPESLDATQRERLETSARELRGWLGMGLEGIAATPPASAQTFSPPMTAQPVKAPPPVTSYHPAPVVPPVRTSAPAGKPAQPGKEDAAPVEKSMVMQIEDILQDMIAGTPLETRGIHLIEDPGRGVRVQVGIEFFDGIEAVSDPEVKATIRKAVETWESTQ